MKLVIIGSGNVATVFGRKILQAGDEIIQVVGRNAEATKDLASDLNTAYTTNIPEINLLGDIYIVAVPDRFIGAVADQLKLDNKIIVHTAAAVSKEALAGSSPNYGVLYPLQTFRKEIRTMPMIPLMIDGSNDQTRERLIHFAAKWADSVTVANDEERLKLHVAAVFVNNFTNYLFTLAEEICDINKLDFNILKPLIKETISRIETNRPVDVQTGPAIRKDFITIEKHRKILENNMRGLQLYNVLTNSIISFYDER